MPDGTSPLNGNLDDRPGISPGRPSSPARDRLEKELEDALNAIDEIKAQRARLGDSLRTWQHIVSLTRRRLRELEEVQNDPEQLYFSAAATRAPAARVAGGSVDRFGKFVVPIAERLLNVVDRPITVEEILDALPPRIRDEIKATPSAFSTQFRIRRMFRRNKKFVVTQEGIALRSRGKTKTYRVVAIIIDEDAHLVAIQLDDNDADRYVSAGWIERAIATGDRFVVETNGRVSLLGVGDGQFYTRYDEVENDDFFMLPKVSESSVPSVTIEDGRDLVD